MTRNDPHRPASLVTEDYEYMWSGDNTPEFGPGWAMQGGDYALELSRRLARTDRLGRLTHQCHHCGAHLRYFAILEHKPTGDLIAVGETCLDNRFDRATADFQKMRKAAELDRAKMRIKTAVAEFVSNNPDLAWMAEKVTPEPFAANGFLSDVARKLRQYGEISPNQYNAVVRVALDVVARAEAPVVVEETAPVIEGRIVVTGMVLSTKWQDSDFGGSLKMLVKDDRNFKVWGSVPSSATVYKGDRIVFTATVEKSDKDESFGFFKRPTKAVVTPAPEEPE